jgi:hypothetical protein
MADSKADHKDGELERYVDTHKEVDHVDPTYDDGSTTADGGPARGRYQSTGGRQYSTSGRRLSEWDGASAMTFAS